MLNAFARSRKNSNHDRAWTRKNEKDKNSIEKYTQTQNLTSDSNPASNSGIDDHLNIKNP